MKYHSPQQEHSFGCPYQLGHFPNADHGDDAMLMTLPVRCHCCFLWLPPGACVVRACLESKVNEHALWLQPPAVDAS